MRTTFKCAARASGWVLAAFALSGCGGGGGGSDGPAATTGPVPTLSTLNDMPALMNYYHVPGVSIAIIKDSAIDRLVVYGVRNQDSQQPVTEDTKFEIGSLSKSITSITALKLVQAGQIGLDNDINATLTSWKIPTNGPAAGHPVTLRMLLSHTAGINLHSFVGYRRTDPVPTLLQILNGTPPANNEPVAVVRVPGTSYGYSGAGYAIVAQALTDLTHKPFGALAKESVLDPLAMNDSTFEQPLPAAQLSFASEAHDASGKVLPGGSRVKPEIAPGGLWSTPRDLAKFLIEVALSLQGQSNLIINQDLAAQALTPSQFEQYGLGFTTTSTRVGDQYFGHSGQVEGFISYMIMHRSKGVGLVLLTNSDNGAALYDPLVKLIASTEHWPEE